MHGRFAHVALSTLFLAALAPAAGAATLCVRPDGHGSCYASITEAVAAAAPYDIVRVYPGTYAESVTIDKPLSLLGTNRDSTVIDASGLPYGINVDGYDHPGLTDVTVSSFTIEHAQFEGLLVTNADDVIVRDNAVTDNDRALDSPSCPGLPPPDSQAGEGIDCGEGIHLTGVSHSAVSANIVQRNSGGILLSDDAGPTYDNLVTGNLVADNPFDCGITLASHKPAATILTITAPAWQISATVPSTRRRTGGAAGPDRGTLGAPARTGRESRIHRPSASPCSTMSGARRRGTNAAETIGILRRI
jgi:parallel beta-helix repeat protein